MLLSASSAGYEEFVTWWRCFLHEGDNILWAGSKCCDYCGSRHPLHEPPS